MDLLCQSSLAYGVGSLAVQPDHPIVAIVSGCIGGLIGGLVWLRIVRRRYANLHAVTCGDRSHLHLPRRTAGGHRVWVCGPPRWTTCGDDTHLHIHAPTTTGESHYMCLTPEVGHRYRTATIVNDYRGRITP